MLAFRSIGFFYVAQPSSYDVERTPDECYSRNKSRALNVISTVLLMKYNNQTKLIRTNAAPSNNKHRNDQIDCQTRHFTSEMHTTRPPHMLIYCVYIYLHDFKVPVMVTIV